MSIHTLVMAKLKEKGLGLLSASEEEMREAFAGCVLPEACMREAKRAAKVEGTFRWQYGFDPDPTDLSDLEVIADMEWFYTAHPEKRDVSHSEFWSAFLKKGIGR